MQSDEHHLVMLVMLASAAFNSCASSTVPQSRAGPGPTFVNGLPRQAISGFSSSYFGNPVSKFPLTYRSEIVDGENIRRTVELDLINDLRPANGPP